MYFDTTFFNERYEPQSIQLICEKCGEYIEINYNEEYISKAQSEYCVVTNGAKIICKCGNICQNGLIERKKDQKIIHIQHTKIQSDSTINIPKCPTCSSTNIKKVSGTSKAISVAMFGLLSQKVKKQFHCNNCGYEW